MARFKIHPDYLKSIIFGIEDSLVSTTGVVVGVSVGSNNRLIVILAALVTIAVEATSMAAGQFISERTVHEVRKRHTDSLLVGATMMFFSYFFAGFIPVIPLFVFDYPLSAYLSVGAAFAGLFALGYAKGTLVKKPLRSAFEILFIGGAACLIGIGVGKIFAQIS